MSAATRTLTVDGTRLLLDGEPFWLQGLSFFNAVYNPAFNRGDEDRRRWLGVFGGNGVNLLRVWCQWDFHPPRTYVDTAAGHSLYDDHGRLRDRHLATLIAIVEAADAAGMALEVTLFSHEKQPNLPLDALVRGATEVARALVPYRNLIVQLWNEDSTEVARLFDAVKQVDPERIVTNSPGGAGALGDPAQNRMLDVLTPHTARGGAPPFWQAAPAQLAGLLREYAKPVIDDEPARCGTVQFGGIEGGTRPEQHTAQIDAVRALGAYHVYHHDMFQRPYGDPATPPNGLPDPDFSPFHRRVFDHLRAHPRW